MIKRCDENPILIPVRENSWEAFAVFNPSVVKKDGKYYMLYRAMSSSDFLRRQYSSYSCIGIAESKDGIHFLERRRFIYPERDWERFGCEDPRVVYLDGKYYIFYTAISALPPTAASIKVGVAISRDLKTLDGKYLVTPFNAKAMTLFPRRIKGKIHAILTVNTDTPPAYIAIAQLSDYPELWYSELEKWYENLKDHVLTPDPRRSKLDHIEVGATPIEVEDGWLLIYSYIQNYFSPTEERIFGVEALLLDKEDPRLIIEKTDYPFMVPEEVYEVYGHVPKVVFPTSAILEDGQIRLYYGAADTLCCCSTINYKYLRKYIMKSFRRPVFERYPKNPIIKPEKWLEWRYLATFNPAAIELEGKIYILFRALSADKTSTIGLAVSENGYEVTEVLDEPIYIPREPFEMKLTPGHSGCEDPRIVRMDDKLYMFYTAYDNVNPPRVAVTSIRVEDFLNRNWKWSRPRIISYPGIDDKNACIIPERISGKLFYIHRAGGVNIVYDYIDSIESVDTSSLISNILLSPRPGMWDGKKLGLAAPPIKTDRGWVLFYHGVSPSNFYSVGAALLELNNPERIIARTLSPLLSPETSYEREGYVRNVVFPCGAILRGRKIFLYYGAADTYVCVATANLEDVLDHLLPIEEY